jgi:hypothetical protein
MNGKPPYVKLQNFRTAHADMAAFLRDGRPQNDIKPYASTQTGNFDRSSKRALRFSLTTAGWATSRRAYGRRTSMEHAFADDPSGRHVEGGKQRRGPLRL